MMGRAEGFTLVEAALVIALLGIVAAAATIFIRLPVQGYLDTARRADLADSADYALRRIAREAKGAIPGSVRAIKSSSGAHLLELRRGAGFIRFTCDPRVGTLLRYGTPDNQDSEKKSLLAQEVKDCEFRLDALSHSSKLALRLELAGRDGQVVSLYHEIHVE